MAVREARSCHSFLTAFGNEYVKWVAQRQWLYTLWMQDHGEFRVPEIVGPQAERVHEVFAKRLMTMHDFGSDESDARFAIRTVCGALFYATLVAPRLGMASYESPDREVSDIATAITLRITKR